MTKKIVAFLVLFVVASIFLCRWLQPPAKVVSRAETKSYEDFVEALSTNATAPPLTIIKCRDRQSLFHWTSTLARVSNNGGTVQMLNNSVVLATTYWQIDVGRFKQALANLDCDFLSCFIRDPSREKDKDTLYEYRDGWNIVRLTELEGNQLWFRVRTRGARASRDLYILGAQNVAVLSSGKSALRLRILWNCQDQPEEFNVPIWPPSPFSEMP